MSVIIKLSKVNDNLLFGTSVTNQPAKGTAVSHFKFNLPGKMFCSSVILPQTLVSESGHVVILHA